MQGDFACAVLEIETLVGSTANPVVTKNLIDTEMDVTQANQSRRCPLTPEELHKLKGQFPPSED